MEQGKEAFWILKKPDMAWAKPLVWFERMLIISLVTLIDAMGYLFLRQEKEESRKKRLKSFKGSSGELN